jgi:hypothetical protein
MRRWPSRWRHFVSVPEKSYPHPKLFVQRSVFASKRGISPLCVCVWWRMLDFQRDEKIRAFAKAKSQPLPEPNDHLERWTLGLVIVWAAFAYIGYLTLQAFICGS